MSCVDMKGSDGDSEHVWVGVCLRDIHQFLSDCEGDPQSSEQASSKPPAGETVNEQGR